MLMMNTQNITPKQAADKFTANLVAEGYVSEALHTYADKENNPIFWRARLKHPNGKKCIRPLYKDANNVYHLGEPPTLDKKHKPLYGLQILAENPNATVIIVEGEYPADILNKHFQNISSKICAITSGGATSADITDWEPLANRTCIIWPDNDNVGLKYALCVSTKLKKINCKFNILDHKKLNLPESGDCIDWLKINTSAILDDILNLPLLPSDLIKNEQSETDDDIISKLASLPLLDYERIRIEKAKLLKVRPPILDRLVQTARPVTTKETKIPFEKIELWPQPINPTELLNEINDTINRFVICPTETAIAATLWITMTWFIDAIQIAPLAVITAPEKRCGKSQLLFLFGRLVNRPLAASNITPAALFRSIDIWQPTLLIDEADAFMRENEELRGIINCGHTRDSAKIIRVVGDDYTPATFTVWGAKALAGIGHLPDTIMDRAVAMELRRKMPHETTERLRHAEPGLFKTLSSKLAKFAQDYSSVIQDAKPYLPDTLNDRAQDNWEPLLAIADIADEEWATRARLAATKISGDNEQSQSIGVELLIDIQEIFENQQIDRISSAELVRSLCSDEEKPWATYNRGLAIKPRQIATRLREFGIISNTIRIGMTTAKGYLKNQFIDAFARYIHKGNTVTSQ